MDEANLPTPPSILKQAIKAVPAVKYALGIAGIIAVIAIVAAFGIDFRVALFGAVGMFVLMTMLVIFASLARQKGSQFRLPALVFTWFSLLSVMALAIVLFTSVFWGRPVDLRILLASKVSATAKGGSGQKGNQSEGNQNDAQKDEEKEAVCRDVVDAKKIPRPDTRLPDPESSNDQETNSSIDDKMGDLQATDAIEQMAKLAEEAGTPDECNHAAYTALRLWDSAQANWNRALQMTKNQERISFLKAKLQPNAGITCSTGYCEPNHTEFYRANLGSTFILPVGAFPPRANSPNLPK